MFEKIRRNSAINRLIEERLYELALDEIEAGSIRKGLWAKALANSKGNENVAKAEYLKYRVQSMHDEANLIDSVLSDIQEDMYDEKEEDEVEVARKEAILIDQQKNKNEIDCGHEEALKMKKGFEK